MEGALRLPIAPPELKLPDDHFEDGSSSHVARLEQRLEEWMQHLDRRLDQLSHLAALTQDMMGTASDETPRGFDVAGVPPGIPGFYARPPFHPDVPVDNNGVSPGRAAVSQAAAAQAAKDQMATAAAAAEDAPSSAPAAAFSELKSFFSRNMTPSSNKVGEADTTKLARTASKSSDSARSVEGGGLRRSVTEEKVISRFYSIQSTYTHRENRKNSRLVKMVKSTWFDAAITMVVLFNAVMIGVQVQTEAINGGEKKIEFVDIAEYVCTGIFTFELVLRIVALGFFELIGHKERSMFAMDVFLVLISWVDIVLSVVYSIADISAGSSFGKLLKVVRLGRVMRILRTVRLLAELRVMASMIINSFRSIMWLLLIIVAMEYCFALILTQGATSYLSSPDLSIDNEAEIREAFGSLFSTMYSLFKSMTGGRNWGEIADLIAPAGWVYRALVMTYVFVNLFSVLNIVTGVFVDGAIELAKRDRSLMIQKQGKKREASANHLMHLLRDIDSSGDGIITREEFLESINRHDVREFMEALAINHSDASNVFSLLDRNMDGQVDIVEFVQGMERLRGEAKSSDIQMLIMQTQHIMDMVVKMQGILPRRHMRVPGLKYRNSGKGTMSGSPSVGVQQTGTASVGVAGTGSKETAGPSAGHTKSHGFKLLKNMSGSSIFGGLFGQGSKDITHSHILGHNQSHGRVPSKGESSVSHDVIEEKREVVSFGSLISPDETQRL